MSTLSVATVGRKGNSWRVPGRIAYVVSYAYPYANHGYAVRTHGVATALQQHGHSVIVISRPGRPWDLPGFDDPAFQPYCEIDGVRYLTLREPSVRGLTPDEWQGAAAETLAAMFRVFKPSVVMAASNWENALPALKAARTLGLPFFYEVRGFWEITRASREPEWAQSPEYRQAVERKTWIAQRAEGVFTLNDLMRDELVRRGVPSERIELVPNGVGKWADLELVPALEREALGCESRYVVGYVGSFDPYEGLGDLIRAGMQLVESGIDLSLLLVGSSRSVCSNGVCPEALTYRRLAIELGFAERLILPGRVTPESLSRYYGSMDLVVIPRQSLPVTELVSPIKPLEAAAHGKALLLSDVAPLAEFARGTGAAVFRKGDVTHLAEQMRDLLSDDSRRRAMGEQARAWVRAQRRFYTTVEPITHHFRRLASFNPKRQLTPVKSPTTDMRQVDYTMATQWFYREGKLTDTLRALDSLQSRGVTFDKSQRDFKAFVEGLVRLKGGWSLPPRQPNAGLMTRRQHLLYCLHQSVPHATNGYSTRSHGIAVGLQQSGWTVRATTRPGFPWDAGVKGLRKGYHDIEVDGVTYAASAGWSLAKTPLDHYLAEAADHYMREAQTSGAEVIVAASNHITALPALAAARRLGLPFLYEVRGLWEVTEASIQPDWAGSERYRLMRRLEQQVALEADRLITLTEELADELVSWGVPRERIEIVPNAVDAERFKPMAPDAATLRELALTLGVPVIGYAGSAVAYEGLELLMEALAQLKQHGQDFVFVLVGDGKVIDTVRRKAKALDLDSHCRFTGRVPFDQVPRYLSCMDILPVPRLSSAVTEMVSALKPLEAMAMGKAVVLSDVSPHRTMAGDNIRARLFRKDDARDLSAVLLQLLQNPGERARLGQAARAWIEQERSWAFVTSIYTKALQRLRRIPGCAGQSVPQQVDARRLDQITLGLIADQFTTDTLASAVKVVRLSPKYWRQELTRQPIDALFVESAWKGNEGQWHRKVGHYNDEEFAPLGELLAYCREQGIPSLFWNKEDPVHFDRFRKAASLCDHVFTTDSRRIIPYLATPGGMTRTASSCPFYASPKIHNLLPSTRAWQPTAAYGGTYYGNRYPERTEYMDKIMSAAAPLGLTIYDRQHDDPQSPYRYPGGLGGYVAGGLSYEEMIQAYKAHPVQINVNSVLDSPTMFSRRVVETAACGVPLISSPALGMNRYLEGAGHIVRTESEAAQALENLLQHPPYRWRMALRGARAIMRAHTTQHRLVQMLRTAGLVMLAPEPPCLQVMTKRLTETSVKRLLAQTWRPQRIVVEQWQAQGQDNLRAVLEAAGIDSAAPEELTTVEDELWLLVDPPTLETLEPEDFEDLIWTTVYASQRRICFIRETTLEANQWPGVALEKQVIDPGLELLRVQAGVALKDLPDWAARQPTLALRKPLPGHEQPPDVAPKRTLLIAGHDLKFIKPFYPYFTLVGIRVLLDFWSGHSQHNEVASRRLLAQADTVFCEWMLGNAIWYGKHKREGQKLVGRLHAQELRSALFDKVPFERFETVIFVGPHMLRSAQERNPTLKKNGVVIYNGVDVEALQAVPRKPTNGKVLGFVGMVPQSKRLDLALDILKELRKDDMDYTLRVKGKRPEEYGWMKSRFDEMTWYEQQYRRLEDDPLLKNAVIFDPYGNDMPEWYAGIDYVLSTSDFESFHLTIADGAAAGCIPVILPWEGASEIYPKSWVVNSIDDAKKYIRESKDFGYLNFLAANEFDIKKIFLCFLRFI